MLATELRVENVLFRTILVQAYSFGSKEKFVTVITRYALVDLFYFIVDAGVAVWPTVVALSV